VRCLQQHADSTTLMLRLTFVLGNLTAKSDRMRKILMFECEGATLLPSLLSKYWRQDRQLAQVEAENGRQDKGQDAKDVEGVLVKLVRLVANVTMSSSIGTIAASSAGVVDPLLDILGCKRMQGSDASSEELVLNTVAAITNLLFYDSPTNILFKLENKKLLCRLLRPLLLESYNIEALIEAARALGNLSRHLDARETIRELRLDEVLTILLGHADRDLVFYVCGALVNLASDPDFGARLSRDCDLRSKLAAILHEAPAEDPELLLVTVKVLSNLHLDKEAEAPWQLEELQAVREGLRHICDDCAAAEVGAGDPSPLLDLASGLLTALPTQ